MPIDGFQGSRQAAGDGPPPIPKKSSKTLFSMLSFQRLFGGGKRKKKSTKGDDEDSSSSSPSGSPQVSPKSAIPMGLPKPIPLDMMWDEEGYRIAALIGEGAYCSVFLGYPDGNLDADPYAIKRVCVNDARRNGHVMAELAAFRSLGGAPKDSAIAALLYHPRPELPVPRYDLP